jgi:hypothetical protein
MAIPVGVLFAFAAELLGTPDVGLANAPAGFLGARAGQRGCQLRRPK